MRKPMIALALAASAATLGGCASDYYGSGYSASIGYGRPYYYSGFYDGFYGPVYDGYWGVGGAYYYRRLPTERFYYRADPGHFYRYRPRYGGNWQPFRHEFRPAPGLRTPGWHGGRGWRR
ncbi:MAG: hypothetical protein RQ833_01715 [Sphingomonadaceae bacterium]|nr:hypothetical protein [Sphingomonadaceae bacterium]